MGIKLVPFLLSNSPASEFLYADVSEHSVYLHRQVGACRMKFHSTRTYLPMKMETVFRNVGI